jgi:hypothetical protein
MDFIRRRTELPPRIQPPRKTASTGLQRETCKPRFDGNSYVKKILGPKTDRVSYVADYSTRETGDFTFDYYNAYSNLSQQGTNEFEKLKANQIPILGLIFLVVAPPKTGAVYHTIAYLLQPGDDGPKLWLFETYDTTKYWLQDSKDWAQKIAEKLGAKTFERAVPSEMNIQQFDEYGKARCIMWSLIFLDFLKKMELRTANREDFLNMYNTIAEDSKTNKGFLKLQSIVYGASRKTLKRKHRKVKTRRHGSSL